MKTSLVLILCLLQIGVCFAQIPGRDSVYTDTLLIAQAVKADTFPVSSPYSSYGELLNDDPEFNPRYPVWVPAIRVATTNVFNWTLARYFFKYDWARINRATWEKNLKGPWVWDKDRFGINFIGHPHTGNYYYNVARSNGYTFLQSTPFVAAGSLMWELFGENEPPSKNDIINTTASGMLLGEIIYRVSSNILDDRTRGGNRVFREVLAGLINPTRALNRLTQGKMFRVTPGEVYQKEPLNITLNAGIQMVNENNKFGSGLTNAIVNLQLDYGDPFEIRRRKPFDVFRFRIESRFGINRKLLDNVLAYGFLLGRNIPGKKNGSLAGIFQYYDYWNSQAFELGMLGFGPGILSKIDLGRNSKIYSGIHLAAVPLAGNKTRFGFGPDSSQFRDYNFGGGFEVKIEETIHLNRWISLGFNGYYYWIFEYEGLKGKSRVGIMKPRILLRPFRTISIGFEHHIYYHNRLLDDLPVLHQVRTEQKLFLQIYLEDRKRRGRYQ